MMPGPVDRCTDRCAWRDDCDHNELLAMQEDGAVLAEVLAQMCLWGANNRTNCVGLWEIGDFVRAHNWPDPLAARWLADNLERIWVALNPAPVKTPT